MSNGGVVLYVNESGGPLMRMWKASVGMAAGEDVRKMIAETVAGKTPRTVEIECEGRTYSFVVVPLAQAGYVNMYGRDITVRKRAEEALRKSEERFRSALDSMMEGCQILGFDWRYIYLNDIADKHNQRPKEELLGNRYMDMWPGIEATNVFKLIKQCMEERTSHSLENEFVFPDGTIGWFDLKIYPVPEGVFILSLDITERKKAGEELQKSEERFRIIAEEISLGIAITRLSDSTIVFANPAYHEMFGLKPGELIGHHAPDRYWDPADREALMLALKNQGSLKNYPLKFKKPDGSAFWVESTVQFIEYQGEPVIMGSSMDITERRRAEEQIQNYMEELRASNEELERFNRAAVDRELRMIELKKEINSLSQQAGREPPYPLDFGKEQS
jgi:PAS domain S-box-containing protein